MIKPVLFIVVLLLMVPVVYVLFFTKILDRLIGRLRPGNPTRPVSGAGKIIDATVVSETESPANESIHDLESNTQHDTQYPH
jgi:hypothetical protein